MNMTEVSQVSHFRIYLQNEFIKKCKTNSKFSLRSFARKLDVNPSTLSQILAGKRPVTRKRFIHFSEKLSLTPQEHEHFFKSITNSKIKNRPSSPERDEQHYQDLTMDTFAIISDWYHFAILELIEIKGFKEDFKWIAKTLGISINEAKIAIDRLKRVGILKVNKDDKWVNHASQFTTTIGNDFTNRGLKKLQKQILMKALDALEEVHLEERDQTGMLMAMHKKQLPEIKQMIKNFRRKLCSYVNKAKSKDAVYQLGISFYPLTKTYGRRES